MLCSMVFSFPFPSGCEHIFKMLLFVLIFGQWKPRSSGRKGRNERSVPGTQCRKKVNELKGKPNSIWGDYKKDSVLLCKRQLAGVKKTCRDRKRRSGWWMVGRDGQGVWLETAALLLSSEEHNPCQWQAALQVQFSTTALQVHRACTREILVRHHNSEGAKATWERLGGIIFLFLLIVAIFLPCCWAFSLRSRPFILFWPFRFPHLSISQNFNDIGLPDRAGCLEYELYISFLPFHSLS